MSFLFSPVFHLFGLLVHFPFSCYFFFFFFLRQVEGAKLDMDVSFAACVFISCVILGESYMETMTYLCGHFHRAVFRWIEQKGERINSFGM